MSWFSAKQVADDAMPTDAATPAVAVPTSVVVADLKTLLMDKAHLKIPKAGDLVRGKVIGLGRNEVKVDIEGFRAGIVRGREIVDESGLTSNLKLGDDIEAVVVDLENERGLVELSFRSAGHQKAWNEIAELRRTGAVVPVRVLEANKGGLLVQLNRVQGFLPVSQLSPSNYPRVTGGDRQKIFEKLRTYVGKTFEVKAIDLDEREGKLIVSEKAAWEDRQAQTLAQYHAGDTVEGVVTALADFGAFVRFPIAADAASPIEGLAHISEISWQRVEHPRDVVQVGQRVTAKIIGVEGTKIFLSLKRLTDDPWLRVGDRYHIGDTVRGTVAKVQPFGLFVELDQEIQGLAHVSELADPPPASPEAVAKVGDVLDFTIISMDPGEHRLGLSRKSGSREQLALRSFSEVGGAGIGEQGVGSREQGLGSSDGSPEQTSGGGAAAPT